MNMRTTNRTMIRWILAVVLVALPALAMSRDTTDNLYGEEWDRPENFTDDYNSGDYGRILSADQGGQIIHENPDPTEPPEETATRNAPVFPGDRVVTTAHQRIEVELAGGTLVRLDDGSELLFQALPNPYSDYRDNTILNLTAGSLQVRTSDLGEDTFRVDTPSASVYLLGDGEFRIDLLSSGETVVRSRRGVAELSGDGGSVLVRSGMESVAYTGAYPSEPASYSTSTADRFDRWVSGRDEALRARAGAGGNRNYDDEVVYESLPSEVQPYYRELSGSGSWTYADDYGWVWYPSQVETGWRPYLAGHWSYGSRGYFWVSNENWGWAPYHYGRWDHLAGYGWCWIPGRVFGGAWVSWSWGSAYVGWAPLNYWNRPVYYGPRYGNYYCGGSWTFIGYNHFHNRNYYNHHIGAGHVYRSGHRGAIVTRPPRVGPRELVRDGGSRDRAVRYARDNALNRDTDSPRNRDADTVRMRPGRTARDSTTIRRFRDTENQVMDGVRRRPVTTRRSSQGDPNNPRRTVRNSRNADGANTAALPRPARARSGERQTTSRTGRFVMDREKPATSRRPTTRPQRVKPVDREAEADSGRRVRDLYRGVSRQRDGDRKPTGARTGQVQERRPSRATAPSRRSGDNQPPSRATTPSRTVRPSAPANRKPSARPAPSRSTAPQRKAAPSRSSAPQRKAAPSRSSAPQRRAAPSRSSAPQRRAAPSRSTAPQRRAAPSRSSAPQRRAAPSRSSAPQRRAAPSRSTAPQRKAAPSRSSAPRKSSATRSSSSKVKSSKSRRSGKKK